VPVGATAATVAAGHEKPAEEGCGAQMPADPAAADHQTVTTDESGQTVTAVGNKLAGVTVVNLVEVLARPEDFAGKTIRLEGNVSAMCTHERAWFAVQADDKSGAFVRVIGAPVFLVPEGSVGKKARTEGVVELLDVPAEVQEHFKKEHQLDSEAGQPGAPQPAQRKTVVVRATGAEFI